jgi:hypothetical protein
MELLKHSLNGWGTKELLDEVIRRSASDGPALQLLETVVIRARLTESDHRFGGGRQPELAAEPELVGVGGTTEMGFAAGEE